MKTLCCTGHLELSLCTATWFNCKTQAIRISSYSTGISETFNGISTFSVKKTKNKTKQEIKQKKKPKKTTKQNKK